MKSHELTHEMLLKRVRYDPLTGIFTRVKYHGRASGTPDKDGYLKISIRGAKYQAHRLAWLYMTGTLAPVDMHVDHINGIRDDNRWENLRLTTPTENQSYRTAFNLHSPGRGASGVRGVYWDGRKNRWHVQIRRNQKMHYGGYHQDLRSAEVDAQALRDRLSISAA
jgi:hypothetical protein